MLLTANQQAGALVAYIEDRCVVLEQYWQRERWDAQGALV
jgi:hypothetical protein